MTSSYTVSCWTIMVFAGLSVFGWIAAPAEELSARRPAAQVELVTAIVAEDLAAMAVALDRMERETTLEDAEEVAAALQRAWRLAKHWPVPANLTTTAPATLPEQLKPYYGRRSATVATRVIEIMAAMESRLKYRCNWNEFVYRPRTAEEWKAQMWAAVDLGDPRLVATLVLDANIAVKDYEEIRKDVEVIGSLVSSWPVPAGIRRLNYPPKRESESAAVGCFESQDIGRLLRGLEKRVSQGVPLGRNSPQAWWYDGYRDNLGELLDRAMFCQDLTTVLVTLQRMGREHVPWRRGPGGTVNGVLRIAWLYRKHWPLEERIQPENASIPKHLRHLYGVRTVNVGVKAIETMCNLTERLHYEFDWEGIDYRYESSLDWERELDQAEGAGEPRALGELLTDLLKAGRKHPELVKSIDNLLKFSGSLPLPVGLRKVGERLTTTAPDTEAVVKGRYQRMEVLLKEVRRSIADKR